MKERRGSFSAAQSAEVEAYCREECHLLAQLMTKLRAAHEEIDITLRNYFGPGSTANEILKKHRVRDRSGPKLHQLPKGLQRAVMSAYTGGRFECRVIGNVKRTIHNADVNAAFPYAQATALPCLVHGTWRRVRGDVRSDVESATLAVCRFRVRKVSDAERRALAWGPLACRDEKGSICYGVNFHGWAWWPELAAALRGWPDLVEVGDEAWVFRSTCTDKKCDGRPFRWMSGNYRQRCEWGSNGRGIVRKLGDNSCYGKTVQSVGADPPYQNWIWGGLTTATTRAQILNAICSARKHSDVLSISTDGVVLLHMPEKGLPKPLDTGTSDCVDDEGRPKVFGDWDVKTIRGGGLFVKPGMFIPNDWRSSKRAAKVLRARGIGRKHLETERKRFFAAWGAWDREDYSVEASVAVAARRFAGAKPSIRAYYRCSACGVRHHGIVEQGCKNPDCTRYQLVGCRQRVHRETAPACSPKCKERAERASERHRDAKGCGVVTRHHLKSPDGTVEVVKTRCLQIEYGTWQPMTSNVQFDPEPKRERRLSKRGSYAQLTLRDLGGVESLPYEPGTTTPEGKEARKAREIAEWQHDADGGELDDHAE